MQALHSQALAETFALDHFEATGTWYEIGLMQGQRFRDLIRFTIHYYNGYGGTSQLHTGTGGPQRIVEASHSIQGFMQANFPYQMDELRGLAKGASVDLDLLLTTNFQQVLPHLAGGSPLDRPAETECCNIVFPNSDVGILLGGTCDCFPIRSVLTCRPEEGIPFVCLNWPGMPDVTWGGMNAAGLAFCGASSRPLDEEGGSAAHGVCGLDFLSPGRYILSHCSSVEEALLAMQSLRLRRDNNYTLTDKSGRAVQVQGSDANGQLRIVEMGEDGICCGNFYPWESPDGNDKRISPAAASRYHSLKLALGREFTFQNLEELLRSHNGDPSGQESVCNDSTAAGMIAVPTAGRIFFAGPKPCCSSFQEFPI
jgi:hypothetical protein